MKSKKRWEIDGWNHPESYLETALPKAKAKNIKRVVAIPALLSQESGLTNTLEHISHTDLNSDQTLVHVLLNFPAVEVRKAKKALEQLRDWNANHEYLLLCRICQPISKREPTTIGTLRHNATMLALEEIPGLNKNLWYKGLETYVYGMDADTVGIHPNYAQKMEEKLQLSNTVAVSGIIEHAVEDLKLNPYLYLADLLEKSIEKMFEDVRIDVMAKNNLRGPSSLYRAYDYMVVGGHSYQDSMAEDVTLGKRMVAKSGLSIRTTDETVLWTSARRSHASVLNGKLIIQQWQDQEFGIHNAKIRLQKNKDLDVPDLMSGEGETLVLQILKSLYEVCRYFSIGLDANFYGLVFLKAVQSVGLKTKHSGKTMEIQNYQRWVKEFSKKIEGL
jgi:hypothetical protein